MARNDVARGTLDAEVYQKAYNRYSNVSSDLFMGFAFSGTMAGIKWFGINGGYGFKIGRTEFMYANPNVGGGTIFSYVSKTGHKFRLDYHKIPNLNKGNIWHFHTNYWGLSNSPHRSLNPFYFGKPIK